MSVKIVHAADFHLDSAFGALSAEQARQRRRESRELLTRLCKLREWQNGVDHRAARGRPVRQRHRPIARRWKRSLSALGAMQRASVHRPRQPRPVQREVALRDCFPGRRTCTSSRRSTVERVELPELQCAVYGAAFTAPVQDESLLAGFRAPEDDFVHLMVLHGDISATESRYDPLTKEQIKESGTRLSCARPHTPVRRFPARRADDLRLLRLPGGPRFRRAGRKGHPYGHGGAREGRTFVCAVRAQDGMRS